MSDYLCESCHWCNSIRNDCCRCEIRGPVEMPVIEEGQSAYDVCGDFDNEEDWEYDQMVS